jgi:hypothetical protein
MRRVFRTDEHPRLLASPKGDARDRPIGVGREATHGQRRSLTGQLRAMAALKCVPESRHSSLSRIAVTTDALSSASARLLARLYNANFVVVPRSPLLSTCPSCR